MSNIYGRQVVVPLTNKSGGGVIAGDVVVVDTSNNDAFTTSTAGAFTGLIGIAQETIASNATGRVLTAGYAALVNTSASVTRGNFGKTHTVAKQAVDAGSSRVAGAFCQFLTGGTTPDAHVFGLADNTSGAGTGTLTTVKDEGTNLSTAVTSINFVGAGVDATGTTTVTVTIPGTISDADAAGATPISLSGASAGTGVTQAAATDTEGVITFSNASWQYYDVTSAIGTGDFDVRCRILFAGSTTGATSAPNWQFYVADSSRTGSTALVVGGATMGVYNAVMYMEGRVGALGTGSGGTAHMWMFPAVCRIKRVGTACTMYVSFDEGRSWTTVHTATSSLNIAKIGIAGNPNTSTTMRVVPQWVRSY